MDGFFDFVRKTKYNAAYPAVFTAFALIAVYLVSMLNFSAFDALKESASSAMNVIFSASLCVFCVYRFCKSAKKAVSAICAYLCGDTLLFAAVGAHFSLLFGVVLTLLFCLILRKTDLLIGYIFVLSVCVLVALLFIAVYEVYTLALQSLADALKGRGAAFGVFDNVTRLLFGDYFNSLFYHKSYSVTTILDGKLVSGAADIFNSSDKPTDSTSEFLTGRYFATIFIPFGVFAAIFKRMKDETVFAFLFAFLLSAVFGNEMLFYLMLFLVSPLLYVGSLIVIYISFAVCSFVDIRIGFKNLPDIFSLFRNMDKPVYFLLIGIVVSLMTYFLCRLIAAKFDLLSSDELPRDVKRLVTYLGGRENILKVSDGIVTVSNPNLIDILHVDCDIHENKVELYPDDFELINRLPD
ncbi:MAG: hypothetical protein IJI47_04925 [Eubacterium sp.]|nr:hypothetical protein [Eubacterium sp.]